MIINVTMVKMVINKITKPIYRYTLIVRYMMINLEIER